MSDEITEPTVHLCWSDHAIRRAGEVLRAAGLEIMAGHVEAHLSKPAIEEPTAPWSVISANVPGSRMLEPKVLVLLDGWWSDKNGNGWGDFSTFSDVEVLRVGHGEPVLTEEEIAGLLKDLIQWQSDVITAPEKRCYGMAIARVAALLGES